MYDTNNWCHIKWLCICKEVMQNIMLTTCCVALNAHGGSSVQWICVTGWHTDTRKNDWWENMGLNEYLEPPALVLGGQVVPVYIMVGEEGGQAVERKSPPAADPEGLVNVRSLSRVYPERMLNHSALYTTGHCVPPVHSLLPRLYLVKFGQNVHSQSSNYFLQSRARTTAALQMAEAVQWLRL